MTDTLHHRGPDDEGYLAVDTFASEIKCSALAGAGSRVSGLPPLDEYRGRANLFLGHRRLSILDLSAAGHQPMAFGGNVWIVFNGEIYNYVEVRGELKADGYKFTTASDTEVILAAYCRWGEDCVKRFNGDWAFCIFDAPRRILFLSRDRYGVKPLYYSEGQGLFTFASEIKALIAIPSAPHRLNKEKAFEYYALFCRDHTEETLFQGIHQVVPGENLVLDLSTGTRQKSRYYSIATNFDPGRYDHQKAIGYACDIRELLTDSVRLRLRAEVPVGTCLSGGLDSSAVVAIMSRLLGSQGKDLNTFTASFPGESFDEGRFARLVANHAGVKGHVLYPTKEGYWRDIARVLHHQDEPFGGASIYSEWEVMREASRHVKVILDGHGGDEVFAGYKDYRLSFLANLLLRRRAVTFVREMRGLARMHKDKQSFLAEVKSLPMYALGQKGKRLAYRLYYHRQIGAALEFLALKRTPKLDAIDEKFSGDLNRLLLHYMHTYTLPYLLRGEDRNCMAHSIEARVPFTDYRLVDYVFSIPAVYKIHDGWTKWLLRLAVSDLLPAEIVWRKEKFGFATPRWATREAEWNLWLAQHFSGPDPLATRSKPPLEGWAEAVRSPKLSSRPQ